MGRNLAEIAVHDHLPIVMFLLPYTSQTCEMKHNVLHNIFAHKCGLAPICSFSRTFPERMWLILSGHKPSHHSPGARMQNEHYSRRWNPVNISCLRSFRARSVLCRPISASFLLQTAMLTRMVRVELSTAPDLDAPRCYTSLREAWQQTTQCSAAKSYIHYIPSSARHRIPFSTPAQVTSRHPILQTRLPVQLHPHTVTSQVRASSVPNRDHGRHKRKQPASSTVSSRYSCS